MAAPGTARWPSKRSPSVSSVELYLATIKRERLPVRRKDSSESCYSCSGSCMRITRTAGKQAKVAKAMIEEETKEMNEDS